MTLPLYYYVLGTPLGVLGLFRWACWLIRRIPAVLYRPIVNNYRLSLSIVVPVYQEDPVIFAAAIESWLRNRVHEVILVIDASDARCQQIASRYPVTVLVTDVPGKRDALRKGWNAATTELVALVDSDTIWADDVAAEVCKPFADPRIGGVGTRQSVYGTKGFLARITDMFLDHRYFDENASQSLLGRAVSCLSGRTAVYRRALLMSIEHEFMHETFWGVPCLSGDDKRLTTLVLEHGYLTYMQRSAEVWSTFPNTWRVFFKQRLRWARNTWRSDLRALSRPWVYHHPFLAYTMMDKGLSGFTLLLGPAFMLHALINQNWIFAAVLAGWWQLSRSAKLLPHLRRRPSSFLFIPGYVFVSWIMAIIKLQALLTIRRQRWLTRQVAVENGQVVRTTNTNPTPTPPAVPTPAPTPPQLMSATTPLQPATPSQGAPRGLHFPPTTATMARHPGLEPAQATPTEHIPPVRPRPRPYVLDQPTGPVNAIVPRQTTNSGPVTVAPSVSQQQPHGNQADGKPVESQTQPHQAAVARKGVA
ncbi:MAG: glycosyltransferase [Pseudonocardia sp.]|nr:glycosyltransferase [Pseudonocardia sp.]